MVGAGVCHSKIVMVFCILLDPRSREMSKKWTCGRSEKYISIDGWFLSLVVKSHCTLAWLEFFCEVLLVCMLLFATMVPLIILVSSTSLLHFLYMIPR